MNQGRTLAAAFAALQRQDGPEPEAGSGASPAEPLTPIRPGAFAAWAARRQAPPADAQIERLGRRAARVGPRAMREGPPVI